MNKTRIAIAGAGLIGRAHADRIKARDDCTLAALADPAPAARDLAAQLGAPHYTSLEHLLARDRPDGIILATPNQFHLANSLACLEARVPMLLEKPVTATVAEGERLLAAEAAAGVPILVGHHRAHSPVMARAREMIASGVLGRLVAVSGSATWKKPDHYFDDGPWRREPGGGPILINMIHEVHNLRLLCGEIRAVQAIASHAVRHFPVEDTVAISLAFECGVLGSFMLSDSAASARNWEHTTRENPAYPWYGDEDCYLLSGTRGSLSIPTMRLKTYAAEASWWTPFETSVEPLTPADPLERQLAHFVDVVHGRCAPLVSVRDGVANLRVTEAISAAARSGRTVEIHQPSHPITSPQNQPS